ncbi:uncharacterized protein HaLaN_27263 [Haematococcus lacustris]|uniref:Uncharacterized protein n=1 Tax=Haematococcus lacustris TaxID=44745 RepID=A0A6A0A984_HAELA|nr:uncharacterized protein HaLaN_27263 [Haematococcus lacustris]
MKHRGAGSLDQLLFEPGIQHWVLWSSRPLSHQAVLDEVAGHWPGSQCLHWVNPVQLQSVTALCLKHDAWLAGGNGSR